MDNINRNMEYLKMGTAEKGMGKNIGRLTRNRGIEFKNTAQKLHRREIGNG